MPIQLPTDTLRRSWFLAGPTASGKSATALELATRIDAEIVSMDSMAIYCGMDIGTAKPTVDEQQRVPHHLIDIVDPHIDYSVTEYVEAAAVACDEILSRGRIPLFVGGTGLYLRSLLRGVFEGPEADWEFRRQLETEVEQDDADLHRRLTEVDPETAARLHPNDHRRIIRALEVLHITGVKLSEQQNQPPLPPELRPAVVVWLSPPRDWMHDRINRRVEQMIADGLVDEVRRLLESPDGLSRTARQGLGYKEVIAHLEDGLPLDETINQIQTRTRQFAKRQCTWFRNLEECRPVEMTGDESAADLAERIAAPRL